MDTRKRITELLLTATFLLGVIYPERPFDEVKRFLRERDSEQESVKKYSQYEIEATAPHLEVFHPRLLVWSDGEGFRVYNLDHKDTHYQDTASCGRCAKTIPLMVNALIENFPNRFQPGQSDFQMLWSDADSFQSQCVNKGTGCQPETFSPFPLFGSVPKDPNALPTVKGMPNWFYLNCMFNWRFKVADRRGECWNEPINENIEWDKLIDAVIWRGSDFTFLPTYNEFPFENPRRMIEFPDQFGDEDMTPETIVMKLFHQYDEISPRWKAIALSSQAQLLNETWIDAKFVGPIRDEAHEKFLARGVQVAAPDRLDSFAMSSYKYQLDLGGGGGTSWRGTISKLDMPGVLLHHETPTKDWFYDLMEPFKHYIPVSVDLVDLKAKFEWAEANQDRAKEISQAATKLASSLFSEDYMAKLHQELFVGYLGKVVESYVSTNSSWNDSHKRYVNNGFKLTEVSYCRATRCFTNVRDDIWRSFPYVISAKSSVGEATSQAVSSVSNVRSHQDAKVRATPLPQDKTKKSKSVERNLVSIEEDSEDREIPRVFLDSMEEAALEQMVDAYEEVKLDSDAVSITNADMPDESRIVEKETLEPQFTGMIDSNTDSESSAHTIKSKPAETVEVGNENDGLIDQSKLLLKQENKMQKRSQSIAAPVVEIEVMADETHSLAHEKRGAIHHELPLNTVPKEKDTPDLSQIIHFVESDSSLTNMPEHLSIEPSKSKDSTLLTSTLKGKNLKENPPQSNRKETGVKEKIFDSPVKKSASANAEADKESSHSAAHSKQSTSRKLPTAISKDEINKSSQSSRVDHLKVVLSNQASESTKTDRSLSKYPTEESESAGPQTSGIAKGYTAPLLTQKE